MELVAVPMGHGRHADCAGLDVNEPAVQLVHAVEPVWDWNEPALH